MIIQVDSKVKFLGSVRAFCEEEVKDETMLFNCGLHEAYAMGDNITKDFIEALPDDWFDGPAIVDSRTHMLMPGWHTCIPGWHHDDVPRTRADGQPNYEEGQIRSEHVMLLVGADICRTEFAIGKLLYPVPSNGGVYEAWHRQVEYDIKDKELEVISAPMNTLIDFNDRTWHRGVASTGNGWRFFIRASRHFDSDGNRVARPGKLANEVRKQTQVYLPTLNAGW